DVGVRSRTGNARNGRLLRGQERLHGDVMGRLDGKVAVITGAGGGMGREAALLFCEEGARVCVADVDADAAQKTATEAGDAFAIKVDVADSDSVREMYQQTVERYGGIDVLYNTGGLPPRDV